MPNHFSHPTVSVVIPTRGRPETAATAVQSALSQTFTEIEVIVVVDGPDSATKLRLSEISDSRLRIVELDASVGGSEARNVGARLSGGDWVAFLDDDDEWLPEKLQAQLNLARTLPGPFLFVASRYTERSSSGDRVLPLRGYDADLPFSEFLFCRRHLRDGTGYVQTSTWLVSKKLMDAVPFTRGLPRNQDVDWMLHAMAQPGSVFAMVEESQTIFHNSNAQDRVSKRANWKFQLDWATANKLYLTPEAFCFCIATLCVPDAVRQSESFSTFLKLFWLAVRSKGLTPLCMAFFFYNWIVSDNLRIRARSGNFWKFKVADQA